MLDCPLPIQTSPTRMSETLTVPSPVMVISYGPPALRPAKEAFQRPSEPTIAVALEGPKVMVRVLPGEAQPQTLEVPCWITMWSLRTAGSLISARAGAARDR